MVHYSLILQCYTHTKSSELQSAYYNVTFIRNLQNYSLHTTMLHSHEISKTSLHSKLLYSYKICRTTVYILQCYIHTKSSELVYIVHCHTLTKFSELQSTHYIRTLIRNLPILFLLLTLSTLAVHLVTVFPQVYTSGEFWRLKRFTVVYRTSLSIWQ
jgi:hypothetical protein